jgi:PA14 domain
MKQILLCTCVLSIIGIFTYAQPCTPLGDETSYGSSDVWIGYVYDNMNFTSYKGYVSEGVSGNPNFDENFGTANGNYATNGCPVYTSTFSVRYKLTKTFTSGTYDITVGADDGYRLSLDGGSTWVIDHWVDQSYAYSTYTVSLNGTYNMVLEYYENDGDNRVTFSLATSCSGTEDPAVYGSSNQWKGYIYDGTNFNSYKGMINEGTVSNADFDENFGGDNVMFSTSGCSVQTETFSARFRLTKYFANGTYLFTVGGDDGFRLSLDGGSTWVINQWWDQSFTTAYYTGSLHGTYNIVLEFYENGGQNRVSFSSQVQTILPIRLLSFSGEPENERAFLHWAISADSDPDHFELERSSDGISFSQIASIAGTSGTNSGTELGFTYRDGSAPAGKSFYRLKMIDMTGTNSYSPIVSLNLENVSATRVRVYPTLTHTGLVYLKASRTLDNTVILVTDLSGRILARKNAGSIPEQQQLPLDNLLSALQPGLYLLKITSNQQAVATEKIIKQ